MYKLSTPRDLLRFKPLSLWNRLRLGMLVPRARLLKNWRALESRTAREWLIELAGPTGYRVVWEPLLRGKFGDVAEEISAVWLWNKLCLRGGSRSKKGDEILLYYKGGFAALTTALGVAIRERGGAIITGAPVGEIVVSKGRAVAVRTPTGLIPCDDVIITTPLPIAADLLEPHVDSDSVARLRRVRYLANICLVLELSKALSDLYWVNVNDPSFPFVGVIEHTNFESPAAYGNRHIVYLSRYLQATDPVYGVSDDEYLAYALPHLRRMFPTFDPDTILRHHVWRADHAQPIVERDYSTLIPPFTTPVPNIFLSSMAQIYPEDRGTNYAVRGGRSIAALVAERWSQ
jgi:protoporphyrinogen oxidase